MKNHRLFTAGVILLATTTITCLNAQSPHQRHRQGGPEFNQEHRKMHRPLAHHFSNDLSEKQKEEIKALKTENYKTMKPLKNKMVELRARERTLLSENEVDMQAVNKIIDQQTDLMNKIRKIQVENRLKTKSILTDEQIMKMEQRRQFMKHRRSHRNTSITPTSL